MAHLSITSLKRRLRSAGLALAAAVGPMFAQCGPAQSMVLWGSSEFRLPGPELFPQYVEMVRRYVSQYQGMTSACTTSQRTAFCVYIASWAELIKDAEATQGMSQLEMVNAYFNDFAYVTDMANWNVVDYWATPLQFYDVDGDCEDYAISKYYTLRGLGYDPSVMRIVVVMDENLGVHHAVLAIDGGSEVYILDNQISGVVAASRIAHYTPIMSINEVAAWRHR